MLHEISLLKILLLRGFLNLCIDPETQKCWALPPKPPQKSLIGLIKSPFKHICRCGMSLSSSWGSGKGPKFDVFSAVDKIAVFAYNSGTAPKSGTWVARGRSGRKSGCFAWCLPFSGVTGGCVYNIYIMDLRMRTATGSNPTGFKPGFWVWTRIKDSVFTWFL